MHAHLLGTKYSVNVLNMGHTYGHIENAVGKFDNGSKGWKMNVRESLHVCQGWQINREKCDDSLFYLTAYLLTSFS